MQAAANLAYALHKLNGATAISLAVPEANSMGLALFGAPDLDAALARVKGSEAVVLVPRRDAA